MKIDESIKSKKLDEVGMLNPMRYNNECKYRGGGEGKKPVTTASPEGR